MPAEKAPNTAQIPGYFYEKQEVNTISPSWLHTTHKIMKFIQRR